MKWFNPEDIVYFIVSNRNAADFVTIKFDEGNCGPSQTRICKSKLYRAE